MRSRVRSGALLAMMVGMVPAMVTSAALYSSAGEPGAVQNDDQTIVHVLNRIGFGPRPGDLEKVRALGVGGCIEQQLHPERIADAAMNEHLADLPTLRMSSRQISEQFALRLQAARRDRKQAAAKDADATAQMPNPAQQQANRVMVELTEAKVLRAAYSDRQLQEVLVDF